MTQRTPADLPEDEDDPVYEQAALWVVRLSSPDATAEDRQAFEAWRAADPAHADAYAEMDEWRRAMGRAPDPRRRRSRLPKGLAVVAVVGLAGMFAYQQGLIDRFQADAWTGVGGFETVMFEDGSRADLNTDTALALRFTPHERGVELLRGEAVFDVMPDPRRPFVVRGHGVSARAVGTRFYVRVDDDAPVGVAEGRVEVSTSNGAVEIGAGEIASAISGRAPKIEKADVAEAIAWRDGKLIVSGRPLSRVVAELDRYRSGRIVLLDGALAARRFSGTLDIRDTDDALDVLAASMRLRVTRVTPFLVLIRPGA
ncbi:FecR family protein [Methylopila henanensis]|uniref:FecR family protein n=1 Tax=Methylopila henanensis TaxID=873516 RepID=A0ABW4KEK4_9HYPH